jgi:plasmid stabilization system protein ParE
MNFTVIWNRRALNQLAAIWTNAADRAAVTAAADRMDAELAVDPLHAGESRHGRYRVLLEWPLSILFWVDSARRTVRVVSVVTSGRLP